VLGEVLERALWIGLHGVVTLLPVGRAHLTVLVGELEGIKETECLLDVATDRKVIDGNLSHIALIKL
jgi:hypothetical protein